jgi:hypothetical protein
MTALGDEARGGVESSVLAESSHWNTSKRCFERLKKQCREQMMTKHRNYKFALSSGIVLLSGIVLAFAGVILAQSVGNKTLIVNGKSAGAVVREFDGHTYIEIEALARATNGIVTIEPARVLLTIPAGSSAVTSAAGASNSAVPANVSTGAVKRDISPDFRRAAIAELSDIREWRGAVGAMVTYGLAASDVTANDYHDRCEDGLNEASVAVTTESDAHALELLRHEFENMNAWANQILAERKKLNGARTVTANALQKDSALAGITACGRFLSSMIVSGDFSDDGSCH